MSIRFAYALEAEFYYTASYLRASAVGIAGGTCQLTDIPQVNLHASGQFNFYQRKGLFFNPLIDHSNSPLKTMLKKLHPSMSTTQIQDHSKRESVPFSESTTALLVTIFTSLTIIIFVSASALAFFSYKNKKRRKFLEKTFEFSKIKPGEHQNTANQDERFENIELGCSSYGRVISANPRTSQPINTFSTQSNQFGHGSRKSKFSTANSFSNWFSFKSCF
ncbi:hypothetical protein O181_000045 [Austropuccinia psidii MF-1]|uniref:Uncharacterized protein n=1 Tax=Austropuccinia psidii MF-1 TaxID=1389203 RepID=A0A9Q3GAG5_9BASI|nr:hypothetical protein [Austropuccinia psidii MF-1]